MEDRVFWLLVGVVVTVMALVVAGAAFAVWWLIQVWKGIR